MKVGRGGGGPAGRTHVFPVTGLTEGVVLIVELDTDTAGGSFPTCDKLGGVTPSMVSSLVARECWR